MEKIPRMQTQVQYISRMRINAELVLYCDALKTLRGKHANSQVSLNDAV